MNEGALRRLPLRLLSLAVCIALAVVAGQIYGRGAFFLVLAGGGLLLTILLFWQSTQNLTGDAPLSLEEALSLGAPRAEEERKQAVLRVLKDLEYERAVGKIADHDFQELSRKYRAEARALLETLDEELGPARERAQRLFEARLEQEAADAPRSKKRRKGAGNEEAPADSESPRAAGPARDAKDPSEHEADVESAKKAPAEVASSPVAAVSADAKEAEKA